VHLCLETADSHVTRDDAFRDHVDLGLEPFGDDVKMATRFRRRALDQFLEVFIHRQASYLDRRIVVGELPKDADSARSAVATRDAEPTLFQKKRRQKAAS
jgi:imidazole glycerol phosphate synthase subunit HisF